MAARTRATCPGDCDQAGGEGPGRRVCPRTLPCLCGLSKCTETWSLSFHSGHRGFAKSVPENMVLPASRVLQRAGAGASPAPEPFGLENVILPFSNMMSCSEPGPCVGLCKAPTVYADSLGFPPYMDVMITLNLGGL